MSLIAIILIILLISGVGFAPAWNWNQGRSYGWGPSGGIIGILVLLLVLRLIGII